MALPTLTRTWNFSTNNFVYYQTSDYTTRRALLYAYKCAFTTMGWYAVRSSNGSTVSNSDLWTSESAVVGSTGNRSWIVLQSPAGFSTTYPDFQLLFDWYTYDNGQYLHIECCYQGYNLETGTTSTKPSPVTGGTRVVLRYSESGNTWYWDRYTSAPTVFHYMWSADKQAFRIFAYSHQYCKQFWWIEKAEADPTVGSYWSDPIIMNFACGSNDTYQYNTFEHYNEGCYPDSGRVERAVVNGIETGYYLSCEGFAGGAAGKKITVPSDVNGGYLIYPIWLVGRAPGCKARLGRMVDMWFFTSGGSTGMTCPADGSRLFYQNGHFLLPWDGATYPMTSI